MMPPVYQRAYSDRVIAANEPYNKEALSYLDHYFKEEVTVALETCLDERPQDPVKFVAERLRKAAASAHPTKSQDGAAEVDANFDLNLEGGLHCVVKSVRAQAKPAETVAGLPVVKLTMPTLYDMESTLAMLRETTSSSKHGTSRSTASVLVVVEPPAAPEEVVFLKGVPYTHTLTETLEYHRRRRVLAMAGVNDVDDFRKDVSADTVPASEEALTKLRGTLGEDLVGFRETIDSLITEDTSTESGCTTAVAFLPSVQKSFLDVFDIIDGGFRRLTHPRMVHATAKGGRSACTESDAALMSWSQTHPPSVLFISFNVRNAPLTVARLLASFVPYYETTQLEALAAIRESNKAQLKAHNLEYCTEHWRGVHKRREAFDKITSVAVGGSANARRIVGIAKKAVAATRPPSATRKESADRSLSAATNAAAVETEDSNSQQPQRSKEIRRQDEDTVFLQVVRELQSLAAITVQANFRGYRARKALRAQRQEALFSALRSEEKRSAVERNDNPYPRSLPPLVALVAERLHAVHGELFGNYEPSPPPQPRVRPVYIAKRVQPKAGEEFDGEAREQWEKKSILLPPQRSCERLPHFNPLRRVLEYHSLAGCDVLHEALVTQKQLSGLSVLQHRAYNQLKSVALDLLHVAHAELFHRGQLPLDQACFSRFVKKQHAPVLAWFSQPHLLSRARLLAPPRGSAAVPNGVPVAVTTSKTLAHERMFVSGAGSVKDIFLSSARQPGPSATFRKIAENVFLADTALPMGEYEQILGAVADEMNACAEVDVSGSEATTITDPTTSESNPKEFDGDASQKERKTPRHRNDVTIVNLCPYPTVYVKGRALVTVPISPGQELDGRPASNHVVLDADGQTSSNRAPVLPEDKCAVKCAIPNHEVVRLPSPAVETSRSEAPAEKKSYSQVVDGIEFRRRSQVRATLDDVKMTESSSPNSSAPSARSGATETKRRSEDEESQSRNVIDKNTDLASVLGSVCIANEEAFIARQVRAKLSEGKGICLYEAPGMSSSYVAAMQASHLTPISLSLAEVFCDEIEAAQQTKSLTTQVSFDRVQTPKESPVARFVPAVTSSCVGSPVRGGAVRGVISGGRSLSPNRRGQRSTDTDSLLGSSDATFPMKSGGSFAKKEIPVTEREPPAATVIDLVDAVTPCATAFRELAVKKASTLNVQYTRTWFPKGLSGDQWLRRLELFVERALTDLKRKKSTVSAAGNAASADRATGGTGVVLLITQPRCRDQAMFIAATVLLSNAIEHTAMKPRPFSGSVSPAAAPKGKAAAAALTADVKRFKASFLNEFCEILRASFSKAGVDVDACAVEVNCVLQDLVGPHRRHSPAFFTFESIMEDLAAAEREPLKARCEALIIRAVQHAEHFCWLLLLQVFLLLPFVQSSLDVSRDAPLSSFFSFVSSIDGALAWMESMDPWSSCSASCPDSAHLRYSNGLRRWDSQEYICFGAI